MRCKSHSGTYCLKMWHTVIFSKCLWYGYCVVFIAFKSIFVHLSNASCINKQVCPHNVWSHPTFWPAGANLAKHIKFPPDKFRHFSLIRLQLSDATVPLTNHSTTRAVWNTTGCATTSTVRFVSSIWRMCWSLQLDGGLQTGCISVAGT